MRLTDHVGINFNNNMSTAAVFLDIEKAFDTTWHPGLLYKLSKLEFSTGVIKLISSFLSNRKFRVSVEGEISTPREIQAGVPQGSIYTTDRKEGNVLRKLQHGLTSVGSWCERWTIKFNEGKNQAIYFSRVRRLPETSLILNGRNIPFVDHTKYLGVSVDRKITSKMHIEAMEAKALRTFLTEISSHNCAGSKQKSQNHVNANIRNIRQGEAQRRNYKRLKLGGGQAYDRSSD
jgi:hypothetical protein